MFNERTKQPGSADLGVSIHTEDADQLVTIVRQSKSLSRRNETFSQRSAHIRYAFTEEADMMCPVAFEANNKAEKLFRTIFARNDLYQRFSNKNFLVSSILS